MRRSKALQLEVFSHGSDDERDVAGRHLVERVELGAGRIRAQERPATLVLAVKKDRQHQLVLLACLVKDVLPFAAVPVDECGRTRAHSEFIINTRSTWFH